jgi:hypothetical protein
MEKSLKRLKQVVKIGGASTPITAALTQWLNEIEQEALEEKIQNLEKKFDQKTDQIENPILHSHKLAGELLRRLSIMVRDFGGTSFEIGDELNPYIEILLLWKREGLIEGRDAIGRGLIGVRVSNPYLLSAIYEHAYGKKALIKLINLTWEQIKMNRGSAHGEEISNKLSIPLEHVNAVFDVFELEGKGFRSKTIGESYFSARSELISQK